MAKNLKFQPWRGSKYGSPDSIFARPTFILAGSTYSSEEEVDGEDNSNYTDCLVELYLNGEHEKWHNTYTTFINSVFGDDTNQSQRREFFDSVLFNNFLQDYAKDVKDAPKCDYKAKRHIEAFKEILDEHKPDVVIAWGNLVWNALPNDWGCGAARVEQPLEISGQLFQASYIYPYGGREIQLVGVHHPSRRYGRDFHYELFKRLGLLRDA